MNRITVFIAVLIATSALPLFAEDIRAQWELSGNEAVVGQSLILSIEVQGTDKFEPPPISLDGVQISWQGGGPRNSTSVAMINGSFSKVVTRSFVGSWAVKAGRPGTFHLDRQTVKAGGKTLQLSALDWSVTEAQTNADFFLRQELKPQVTVIDLPVTYTLTWYLGNSAQNPEFNLPILDSGYIEPVADSFTPPQGDAIQLDYRGRNLYGLKGTATIDGKQYTTIRFSFKVKPRKAGDYDLGATSVTFEGASSTQRVRDFFGNVVDQNVYAPLASKANPLSLSARELPLKGKPTVFSGLIGELKLSWSGAGDSYQVGEPIRLTLTLAGVENKSDIDLDYMVTTALAGGDFTVSSDGPSPEGGSAPGRNYIFRARHAGSLTIPALKLNYFDPASDTYRETATEPLKLTIREGTAGAMSAPVTIASPGEVSSGADVHPLAIPSARRLPWFFCALPGLLAGLALCAAGIWRHSRLRKRGTERQAWRAHLTPLIKASARENLEHGRERLLSLMEAGPLWRQRLEDKSLWQKLLAEIAVWDRAFFADEAESEDWISRWESFRSEAGGWK